MAMTSSHGQIDIQVTVKTTALLERLKSNRTKHQRDYEQAILAWQKELASALSAVSPEDCVQFPQSLEALKRDCPKSHVDQYDQAIDMFTMCTKDEVTLDSDSFNTFCRDDWGWKTYTSTNRFYRAVGLR